MLHEKLKALDFIITGKITAASGKVLHTLVDEMKSFIGWHDGADGVKYAVDNSTGEVLISLDAHGAVTYKAADLPPMSVLFA